MKTIYLDCSMGAAGDMLTAALLELHPDPEGMLSRLNQLGIPGVSFQRERVVRSGITGTHLRVTVTGQEEESVDVPAEEFRPHGLTSELQEGEHEHHHHHYHGEEDGHHHHHHEEEDGHHHHHHHGEEDEHHHHHHHGEEEGYHHHHHHEEEEAGHHHHHEHHSLEEIEALIRSLALPEVAKEHAIQVYRLIAQAEGEVHGTAPGEVHFHEVGTLDAVADVSAVCLLLYELSPDRLAASPVHVGSGQVRCAHGILPVPAPATALLLRGIPSYGGEVRGELCTPTGAALLRHFVRDFGPQPLLRVERLGYGCGSKEFPGRANCLRAILGETEERREDVLELSCNLDDMTPEALGFAQEELLAAGALDVYTQALGMKKNRPGVMLSCLCREEQREELLRLLFRHTSTLGVREARLRRYVLEREAYTVDTPHGPVRLKRSVGYGVSREKPEYEDLARIAREKGCSLAEAAQILPLRRES